MLISGNNDLLFFAKVFFLKKMTDILQNAITSKNLECNFSLVFSHPTFTTFSKLKALKCCEKTDFLAFEMQMR